MTDQPTGPAATRDRLLQAAATLMDAAQGRAVSTREICDLAGVQAPTLYHHFGSKQGLVDAVLQYGFGQYVASRRAADHADRADPGDPVDDLRRGWDHHVDYGLEHPAFYALVHGSVTPGVPCGISAVAQSMLLELLQEAALQSRLQVPPRSAAARIAAANVGVTLALIAQPVGEADLTLSVAVREAVLASVLANPGDDTGAGDGPDVRRGAGAVAATRALALTEALRVDGSTQEVLSPGERLLLDELLGRLGRLGDPRTRSGL